MSDESSAPVAAPDANKNRPSSTVSAAPKPDVVTISDLRSLLGELQQKTKVRFTLAPSKKRRRLGTTVVDDIIEAGAPIPAGVKVLEISLRPLSEDETTAADAIRDEIVPPRKPTASGSPPGSGEFDYENKEYGAKFAMADAKRSAFLIEKSADGFIFDGPDLEAKAAFMKKTLPRRVINFLVEQIEAISANDIRALDLATFSSSAG